MQACFKQRGPPIAGQKKRALNRPSNGSDGTISRLPWWLGGALVFVLLFAFAVPTVVEIARGPATVSDTNALLATIGGVMGAVFAVGGLVVALASVLTLLTVEDRAKRAFQEQFDALRPELENLTDRRVEAHMAFREAKRRLEERPSYSADPASTTWPWQPSELAIQEVLELYPNFPGVRRYLGLELSRMASDVMNRAVDHGEDYDTTRLGQLPERAIYWLADAIRQGEDADGAVSIALSQMYGLAGQCDEMMDTIGTTLRSHRTLRSTLLFASSMILLANACLGEPDQHLALQQLGGMLQLSLPATAEAFATSVDMVSTKMTGVRWIAVARRSYWAQEALVPKSAQNVLVFIKDETGTRLTRARYFLSGTGPRTHVGIPTDAGEWLPIERLFARLNEQFLLVCPGNAIEAPKI